MGMFDRVWITCPECGKEFEQQTKAGPCLLIDYHLSGYEDDIPPYILEDLENRPGQYDFRGYDMKCDHCGCEVEIEVHGRLVGKPIKRRKEE
jgi:hypothetical protein